MIIYRDDETKRILKRTTYQSNLRRVWDPCDDITTSLIDIFRQIDVIREQPLGFVYREEHGDTP